MNNLNCFLLIAVILSSLLFFNITEAQKIKDSSSVEIVTNAVEHTVVLPFERSFLFVATIKNKGDETIKVKGSIKSKDIPEEWHALVPDGYYRIEPGQQANFIIVFETRIDPPLEEEDSFVLPVFFDLGNLGIKKITLTIKSKWISDKEMNENLVQSRFLVIDKNTQEPISQANILATLPSAILQYRAQKKGEEYILSLPSKKFVQEIYKKYEVNQKNKGYFLQVSAKGYKSYFESDFLPEEEVRIVSLEPLDKVGEYKEIGRIKSNYSIWWIKSSDDGQYFAFSHGCHCAPDSFSLDIPKKIILTDRKGNVIWERETKEECWGLDISPSGEYVSAGCVGGAVYLWDKEGELVWKHQNENHESRWIKFSPDREYLLTGPVRGIAEKSALFETKTGRIIWEFGTGSFLREGRFSRDGKTVYLASSNGLLHSIDTQTGRLNWMASGDYYVPFILGISEEKNMAVTAGKGRAFVAFDLKDGKRLWKTAVDQTVTAGDIADDGTVLGGTVAGMIYQLDSEGEFVWARFFGGLGHNGAYLTKNAQYSLFGGPNPTLFDNSGNVLWQREKDKEIEMTGIGETGEAANVVWMSEDASLLILGMGNGDIVFYEGEVKKGENNYSQLTGPSLEKKGKIVQFFKFLGTENLSVIHYILIAIGVIFLVIVFKKFILKRKFYWSNKYLLLAVFILIILGIILMGGQTKKNIKKIFYHTKESKVEKQVEPVEPEMDETQQKSQRYCGDGVCDGPETAENCPEDCGGSSEKEGFQNEGRYQNETKEKNEDYCGDGKCTEEENCQLCPEDCGECQVNKSMPTGKVVCGDGECSEEENGMICPEDCCKEGHITTSGYIYCDEIWSGDIYITGDIFALEGTTITILPGTNIWVAAHSDDNNLFGDTCNTEPVECPPDCLNLYKQGQKSTCEPDHITMKFSGNLIAKGTKENWINIHSDADEPWSGDWLGMNLNDAHVEFEYVNASNYIATGLFTGNSYIKNSYFTMTKNCPICMNLDASNVRIEHNHIEYTGGEMVDHHYEGSNLHYNIFGPAFPQTNAIMLESAEGADITHNIFKSNTTLMFFDTYGSVSGNIQYNKFEKGSTLHLGCSTPVVKYNNIYGEVTDNYCIGQGPIDLSRNYWGTTDLEEIKKRINNGEEPEGAREKIIEPILTEPVNIDEEHIGIQ